MDFGKVCVCACVREFQFAQPCNLFGGAILVRVLCYRIVELLSPAAKGVPRSKVCVCVRARVCERESVCLAAHKNIAGHTYRAHFIKIMQIISAGVVRRGGGSDMM